MTAGLLTQPVLLGAGGVFLGLLALGYVVLGPRPVRLPLSRLDPLMATPGGTLSGAAGGATAAVERLLSRQGRAAALAATLDRAGIKRRPAEVVVLVCVSALVAGALGVLLAGAWLAALLPVLSVLLTRLVLRLLTSRRQASFADQLDDSLQLMASSLRAGHSLLRAMDSVSQEADEPTSEEFSRLVNETRVGRDLTVALEELAGRMQSEDFVWVAQAIAIHREVGGNLAEVLDSVGHTIRERNQIRRQVKALSAEGKLSAIVLMALPFGVTGFLTMTNPAYLAKFTQSALGYGLIGAAVIMLLIGGVWLRKITSFRF